MSTIKVFQGYSPSKGAPKTLRGSLACLCQVLAAPGAPRSMAVSPSSLLPLHILLLSALAECISVDKAVPHTSSPLMTVFFHLSTNIVILSKK